MREEIDLIMKQATNRIFELHGVKKLQELVSAASKSSQPLGAIAALLHLAGIRFYFGQDQEAEPVLNAARNLLFSGRLCASPQDLPKQTKLACVYAATLGFAPTEQAQRRIEELFEKLPGIRDTFTTSSHYGWHQLEFLEAVVLAVVSDDFTMGSNVRRLLDDDEFLICQRIHRDMKHLIDQAES